ncbi:MAG: hypothetical protein JJE52_17645 [Acidimicrobiia bacterium]|nr:hypothetical protein [Acidimicrobiia bacterium]
MGKGGAMDADLLADRRGVELVLLDAHRRWEWALMQLQPGDGIDGGGMASDRQRLGSAEILSRLDADVEGHIVARLRVIDPLLAGGRHVAGLREVTGQVSEGLACLARRAGSHELDPASVVHLAASIRRLIDIEPRELLPRLEGLTGPTERAELRDRFISARDRRPARPARCPSAQRA